MKKATFLPLYTGWKVQKPHSFTKQICLTSALKCDEEKYSDGNMEDRKIEEKKEIKNKGQMSGQ